MCYICTMEYYPVTKMIETVSFADMDGPRECHSEWSKSGSEKKYHTLAFICGI